MCNTAAPTWASPGSDTLIEHGADWGRGAGLYQPLDLQIAKCRVSVAVRADFDYASAVQPGLAPDASPPST